MYSLHRQGRSYTKMYGGGISGQLSNEYGRIFMHFKAFIRGMDSLGGGPGGLNLELKF